MKCFNCAKEIENHVKICPYCGAKQGVGKELVEAAKAGDQMAITELYQLSRNNVYYTVKSMIRDEDTVQDMVQDTFLQAFQNLDTLQDPARFQAWVRNIAHNRTVSYLRKKKPVQPSARRQRELLPGGLWSRSLPGWWLSALSGAVHIWRRIASVRKKPRRSQQWQRRNP